jgi:hypothetical protein
VVGVLQVRFAVKKHIDFAPKSHEKNGRNQDFCSHLIHN